MDHAAAPSTATGPGEARRRGGLLILLLLCGAQFMIVIDETVVNVALPSIAADLHLDPSSLAWVVNAYLLLFGGFLLVAGRLGDLVGRRRVFLAGVLLFAGASAAAGFATTEAQLVGARGVQGLGAALMSPTALAIITTTFSDPAGRRRALAVWGALLGVGATAGVLLGGVIVDLWSWHWVFFVNVPVCVVVAAGVLRVVRGGGGATGVPVDALGALLVTAGLLLLVHTVTATRDLGWWAPGTVLGLAGTAALLGAFAWHERRAPDPLVPLRVLRRRSLVLADVAAALAAAALFGLFFVVTLWMQVVQGWSPLQAGLAWAPQGVTVALASAVSARLMPRLGGRVLATVGFLLAALAQLMMLRLDVAGSYAGELLPALLLNGVGLGLLLVPVAVAAVHESPDVEQGLASGLLTTAQQVGGAVGLAALITFASSRFDESLASGSDTAHAAVTSFHGVFLAAAVLLVIGAVVVQRLPALRREVDLATLVA
jgi:EmrB/QacA subfamily drug resistance transporter